MSKSLHSLDNPLHDPNKLLPTRKPSSPNAPGTLPQCLGEPEPNPIFPQGWPTSTKSKE